MLIYVVLFVNYLNAIFLRNINYEHESKRQDEKDIDIIASKQMLKLIRDF